MGRVINPPKKNRLAAKDPAREELRKGSLRKDPEFAGEVAGKARDLEIKNIAKKGLDIKTETERLELEQAAAKPQIVAPEDIQTAPRPEAEGDDARERVLGPLVGEESPAFQASAPARETLGEEKTAQLGNLASKTGGAIVTGAGLNIIAPTQVSAGLGKFQKLIDKNIGKIAAGTAGTSGIMTWLASDNIIASMNIFTRDLRDAVTFGGMDPKVAADKMDEGQKFVDEAREFVNLNTVANPLLWPFRGILMTNIEASQAVLDNNREIITGTTPQA